MCAHTNTITHSFLHTNTLTESLCSLWVQQRHSDTQRIMPFNLFVCVCVCMIVCMSSISICANVCTSAKWICFHLLQGVFQHKDKDKVRTHMTKKQWHVDYKKTAAQSWRQRLDKTDNKTKESALQAERLMGVQAGQEIGGGRERMATSYTGRRIFSHFLWVLSFY